MKIDKRNGGLATLTISDYIKLMNVVGYYVVTIKGLTEQRSEKLEVGRENENVRCNVGQTLI